MTPERAEKAIADANLNIVRLLDEIDRLKQNLRPDAALEARQTATDERAELARQLRSQGVTIRQIARRLERTERQVYRLRHR